MYINWKCYIQWTRIEIKFHQSAFNLNVYCNYVCILIIKDDWSCWIYLNLGFRSYGVITSSEQTQLKFEDGETRASADTVFDDDEIAKIRREFDAAKQSFLKIPQALKEMPKMNPEGLSVHNSCFSVELKYSCQCCYWLMSCIQIRDICEQKSEIGQYSSLWIWLWLHARTLLIKFTELDIWSCKGAYGKRG